MSEWSIRDNLEPEGGCPHCRGTGLIAFGFGPPTVCSCDVVPAGYVEKVAGWRTEHLQVMARAGGYAGWVDELFAPLLEQAWAAGFRTYASCQGGDPRTGWPAGLLEDGMVLTDRDSAWPLTDLWQWSLGRHLSIRGSTDGLVSLEFPPLAVMGDQAQLDAYLVREQELLLATAHGRGNGSG